MLTTKVFHRGHLERLTNEILIFNAITTFLLTFMLEFLKDLGLQLSLICFITVFPRNLGQCSTEPKRKLQLNTHSHYN